jgi:formylglycine-generating enzyme required for sulfatase activity
MGSVFLATDEKMNRTVVLKVPDSQLLQREGFRQRFELETRSLIELSHPHIVKVLDGGTVEGLPYIVLQYLSGGSLEERIEERGGRVGVEDILAWLPDVARTLDFIHGLGVVHRDVKPANILFDEHGHVFLADFGIVKALEGEDPGLTRTGTAPGTPTYMSPEAAMEQPLDGRSDQYALGGVVYRAIAGKLAIEGTTPYEIMVKKHTEDPVSLATAAPEVGEELSRVVMKALSREPGARFPTCVAFAEAFASVATGDETPIAAVVPLEDADATGTMVVDTAAARAPTETAPGGGPARSGVLRKRTLLLGIGALALALALAGWLLLREKEPVPASVRATLVVEEPEEGAITNASRIRIRGRVDGEGAEALLVNGRSVSLDGGAFDEEVDAAEELRFEVRGEDGRTLASATRGIEIDPWPPTLVVEPVASPIRETVAVIAGRVGEPGCTVTVAGESVEVRGLVFSVRRKLSEGPNEIRVVACDRAGNEATVDVAIEVLPEAPPLEAPEGAVAYSPETRRRLLALAADPAWGEPTWSEEGVLEIEHLGTGLRFVLLPAGTFAMGSGEGAEDEKPVHRVSLPAFLLARTECTQAAWVKGGGENDSGWKGETLPVENVSWTEARAWCRENGLRLPSESEWEYACRALGTGRWCFGDEETRLGDYAWFRPNSDQRTHPVGSKKGNRWALHDMHGNVWEWCEDEKSDDYTGAGGDGRAYERGTTGRRVLRGGSWYVDAEFCRSARRNAAGAGARSSFNGFRPAASLP